MKKANILIVDDRADKMLALEAVLEHLGENLVKARSGKEALKCLLQQEFAVILMDVSMPDMDGFETAALIRKRQQTEDTPIIFVTSISDTENQIARGYSLGAVDYILTPIVPSVLQAKVSVFVQLFKKTEQIKIQAEQLRKIEEAEHQRKLAETADRLERETKRNRFFTLAVDMLAIADFNGYILQLNPSWEKILGYSESELKAKSGIELIHPEDHLQMIAQMESLRAGKTCSFEGRYRRKDNSYCWLAWTAAPFASEKLIYIFARDITARKEAEEKIQKLNEELQGRVSALTEINKELEAFNYSISHDMRAPLRSMQGFARALLEDSENKLTPASQDFAQRIVNSGRYMDNLLQDLLEYSRLSLMELKLCNVDMESILNEVLVHVENEIQSKKAEIIIKRPLLPVLSHSTTLKQILSNLVSNALKFVEPGKTPRIEIWSEQIPSGVRIHIQDNGIGISPDYHEKVFGLFQRLHSSHTYPGTGIGLAIVRKGMERMGGRVGVESSPGNGSRFWLDHQDPA
ncbi:ATP-binding protein [Pedosphaera parvula]|uniref:ATP-binding protein n=1 Tax=Pedosphaera parvula TaxID=1032527 RepID=UPI00135F1632|nr:ATP-binding protein [Pedosphaera parvula]